MSDDKPLEDKLSEDFDEHYDEYMKFMHPHKQGERQGKFNEAHLGAFHKVKDTYDSLKSDGKIPERGKEIKDENVNDILEAYLEGFIDKLGDDHHKIVIEHYKKTKFKNEDERLARLDQIYAHIGLRANQQGGAAHSLRDLIKDNKFNDITELFGHELHKRHSDSYNQHKVSKKLHDTIGNEKYHHKGFAKKIAEKLGYEAEIDEDDKGIIHGKEVTDLHELILGKATGNYVTDKDKLSEYGLKYESSD